MNKNNDRFIRRDKGSKLLIQHYVNRKQAELNKQILKSSPSLLAFADLSLTIQWKSPLQKDNYREYRNEFLELVEEWKDKKSILETYWAKQGPHWDGIAVVKGKNENKGLLLVEAKAHLDEMKSKIQAKDPNSISLIKSTLKEVMQSFGSKAPIEIWLNNYYQLANRLAYLYILNEKLHIPTWLILLNFVNDDTHIRTDLSKWLTHYNGVFNEMDIRFHSKFGERVMTLFIEGNAYTE